MNNQNIIKNILANMPSDWLALTTHRLDIYNEERAKSEFLEKLEVLVKDTSITSEELQDGLRELPTAFDYIRLGHPLSCVLEWVIANSKSLNEENVISFSSQTMAVLAILRANHLKGVKTQIISSSEYAAYLDEDSLRSVYGYSFEVKAEADSAFTGTTIELISFKSTLENPSARFDFTIGIDQHFGSLVLVNSTVDKSYISEIQHVRRRESIAMTPQDCLSVLNSFTQLDESVDSAFSVEADKEFTMNTIKKITSTKVNPALGSCGLSIQYAIMMGLVDYSNQKHPNKNIKFIVPANCYGGTNDQARRVAACIPNVEIIDLAVDGGRDMGESLEPILSEVAADNAIPFIIAEIPTNPRVEVPELVKLNNVLGKVRKTKQGEACAEPVFILDQTFCPNVKFLGEGDYLHSVSTISYVSGSKFPSGGLCTAGYAAANDKAANLMSYVQKHLKITANEATPFQVQTLATQMPSMVQRIDDAYKGTRGFVTHIEKTLPDAKINFVSEELASSAFTPSVFSLDLPTKGETHQEREAYKRDLNLKLINLMIEKIPHESKYCVSYGQLKGCYWTIPATSTQGTTKEGDKDYIVRVSISPDFDLEKHKAVFTEFCDLYIHQK